MEQLLNNDEIKSIDEAIKVLERASTQNKKHLQKMMGEDYKAIKKSFNEIAPKLEKAKDEIAKRSQEFVSDTKRKAVEQSSKTAKAVDKKAHEKPWQLAAGALVLGGILGFSMRGGGSKSEDRVLH